MFMIRYEPDRKTHPANTKPREEQLGDEPSPFGSQAPTIFVVGTFEMAGPKSLGLRVEDIHFESLQTTILCWSP